MIVIEYKLKNVSPLIIKDYGKGNSNQKETIKYITGSSVRGFVISKLDKNYFIKNKVEILSDNVKFLNAYPCTNNVPSIPSPKIYYATKQEPNNLSSILDNEKKGNEKRASIGNFCIIEDNELSPINVILDEAMNNTTVKSDETDDKNLFRSSYIYQGQTFCGYIIINDNEKLANEILEIFKNKSIYLGGFLSHGFGKCECISSDIINKMPYEEYRVKESNNVMKMLLLSDTSMINELGEPCGLDIEYLKDKLGNFEIKECSSSIINVYGRNRTIGGNIPTTVMYEKGSVFVFKFDTAPDIKKIIEFENTGIGIRRAEGYGQIVFTDKLPSNAIKKEMDTEKITLTTNEKLNPEETKMLENLAKNYYKLLIKRVMEQKVIEERGKLSKSQLGVILSMISTLKAVPEDAQKILEDFFREKSERKESISSKYNKIKEHIKTVFNSKINEFFDINKETIFGLETKDLFNKNDEIQIKLDFLETEIRYNFRKEV